MFPYFLEKRLAITLLPFSYSSKWFLCYIICMYKISYNFKLHLQNLYLHLKPQDLDKRKPHHPDMRSHFHLKENNTLKIRTVFSSSEAKKIKERKKSHL